MTVPLLPPKQASDDLGVFSYHSATSEAVKVMVKVHANRSIGESHTAEQIARIKAHLVFMLFVPGPFAITGGNEAEFQSVSMA